MVFLALKNKILCSWFLSHHSYSDLIITGLESQIISKFLNTKTVESHLEVRKSYGRTSRSEIKDRRFRCLSLKWPMVKNTVKSFVRENKFHTYLTRETLPAKERVGKLHRHGKTPSYQTFADASMRKVVPKAKRPFFVLRLGLGVTIILLKLSALAVKIA